MTSFASSSTSSAVAFAVGKVLLLGLLLVVGLLAATSCGPLEITLYKTVNQPMPGVTPIAKIGPR
jgi:hypothetical protein